MAEPTPNVTTDPVNADIRAIIRSGTNEIRPDVLMYTAFVNTYAISAGDRLLLIDPGFQHIAASVYEAVRTWSQAPLAAAVYTHGHFDHAFGLGPWLEAGETPDIIAQEHCVERFKRYQLTAGFNARINQRQFSLPKPTFPDAFYWPTTLVRDSLAQRIGEYDVHFQAAKGETDDALYAWLPGQRYLFTGDLVVWSSPNCGNPQKVQRYPVEWAEALDEMAALGAEWLFPGHGIVVHGEDAIRSMLTDTSAWLRSIIEQVLERMNAGQTPEQIFHEVDPDPELSQKAFLPVIYDHPKFIVRNLLRLWGGWWNGNAADLFPAPWADQGREIVAQSGGVDALVKRGRTLLEQGNLPMACHVAEWVTQGHPEDVAAQELKRDAYAQRLGTARETMTKGIYRAALNDARVALGQEPVAPSRLVF